MKKVIVSIISILLLFGCNLSNTPSGVVEKYLDSYINLTDDVMMDLETTIAGENLSDTNKEAYKKVLTREYENLKYEIKDESIDGDKATVVAKITVYDLYKSDIESNNYMSEHMDEFLVNNEFDNETYISYRIGEMLKMSDTIDYELTFKFNKVNDEWVLENPSAETIEKLNGLYDYRNN